MIENIRARVAATPIALLLRRRITFLLLSFMTIPFLYLASDSYQADFRAFYVASTSIAAHLDPYADNREKGEQFVDPLNQVEFSRWMYPPPALFFVAPLAKFSYVTAKRLFTIASLASLVAILVFLSDRFAVADPWTMLAYASLPVVACVERGQVDLIVLLLLVMSYGFGRSSWSGVPLGIAISMKVFPAALLLWLLAQKRFREATVACVCVTGIGLLAAWRFGLSSYVAFVHNVTAPLPAHLSFDPVKSLHGISVGGRWLLLSRSFLGSFDNPLELLGNRGILVGAALVVIATIFLTYRRVSDETGFFSMVLISQLLNTKLWIMGVVMYIPICMIAVSRTKSSCLALLLMIPLFLPSSIEILYVSPRYVIALLSMGYLIWLGMDDESPRLSGSA
jgi:hypothetical protein